MFLTLNPTLSPGTASGRDSWCISTDLTSVEIPCGAKVRSNQTSNLVNILKWKSEWLVSRPTWRQDSVKGFQQSLTASISILPFNSPSFEPRHLIRRLQHIVAIKARNRDKRNSCRVVTNLLNKAGYFVLNFLKTSFRKWWLSRVHLNIDFIRGNLEIRNLITRNNKLLHSQSLSEKSMLASLTVLRNSSLELSSTTSDNQNSTISLGCT
uniref:Uncharacterized protein n=1 Tax=Meloidogyne incognita TaxID=6306 RepID=A0A914KRW3_MELIC